MNKAAVFKQYEELQYKEQRLEVLLQAKGISDCLVLLEEQQANIIADGAALEQQYEKYLIWCSATPIICRNKL